MSETQFESVLNMFNLSLEEICQRSELDESHIYRLLSRSAEPDSITLEKLAGILCVSEKEILRFIKLKKKNSDNLLIYPAFTSFSEPLYIFKLCAFENVQGISLNKYLSFIPEGFKVEYRLLQGEMTIYTSHTISTYTNNIEIFIPSDFDDEEYIADLAKHSMLLIKISVS